MLLFPLNNLNRLVDKVQLLLVEDDSVEVLGIRRALAKAGMEMPLHVAENGLEALEILRGSSAQKPLTKPFLVLLDLDMPKMNGLEFLRELRRDPELHDTIVFVWSTSDSDLDRRESYGYHVAGYISKTRIERDFAELIDLLDSFCKTIDFPT